MPNQGWSHEKLAQHLSETTGDNEGFLSLTSGRLQLSADPVLCAAFDMTVTHFDIRLRKTERKPGDLRLGDGYAFEQVGTPRSEKIHIEAEEGWLNRPLAEQRASKCTGVLTTVTAGPDPLRRSELPESFSFSGGGLVTGIEGIDRLVESRFEAPENAESCT